MSPFIPKFEYKGHTVEILEREKLFFYRVDGNGNNDWSRSGASAQIRATRRIDAEEEGATE